MQILIKENIKLLQRNLVIHIINIRFFENIIEIILCSINLLNELIDFSQGTQQITKNNKIFLNFHISNLIIFHKICRYLNQSGFFILTRLTVLKTIIHMLNHKSEERLGIIYLKFLAYLFQIDRHFFSILKQSFFALNFVFSF